MELFFNELSIDGRQNLSADSMIALAEVYHTLAQYEITTCRIDPDGNAKLFQMIQSMQDSLNIKNFYFAFFRSPYETEYVEERQDEYLGHEWFCNGKTCIGLALALIFDSAALSVHEIGWNDAFVDIIRDGAVNTVRNISTSQHVDLHIQRIRDGEETELIKCALDVTEKEISLRSDHGKDILMNFSKRLIKCPYVVGVINSLPFNSHERNFIRAIREDGLIEIVLPWTDQGYGVIVKTTGRTKKETERIGSILIEKYGGV
ncbi:MAG: hypothetical protein LUC98_07170 [Lachnospiraceae bacterium]|nr:hypothetical protein [Lachnospiraceae bacterium]